MSCPPLATIVAGVGQARDGERALDDLPFAHGEAGMLGAEPPRERADDVMVGPRIGKGLDHLARHLQEAVAARDVDVVVLEEGRRRQDDVGHGSGLGQELLVDAQEEIVARHAVAHLQRFQARPPSGWCSAPASQRSAVHRRDRAGRRSGSRRCATGRAGGPTGRAGRAPRSRCGRAHKARYWRRARRRPHIARRRSRRAGSSRRRAGPNRCGCARSRSRCGYSCAGCGRRAARRL